MNFKNDRLILVLLSIMCIIMIISTSIKDSLLLPLRMSVGYVLMPIQTGVNVAGKALYNYVENTRKLNNALEENKELNERIAELTEENARLTEETFELERLRKLYKLDTEYANYNKIVARVIAKDSVGWFKVFRIDKGSEDGIAVDMNVMANGGLVGIVTDVGTNYATVRAIIDDVSRVSAMAMQSNANCIVAGDLQVNADNKLRITDIDINANVRDGDKIVTSNISTKYLPGILIGYASDITEDSSRLTKSGYLIPVARFDNLQEVLVITDLKEVQKEDSP